MATRTIWIRSLSPCVPYPRDISASCLTLRRFISRRKARFIFFIHHGNCDPKHSSQHRIISARGARKILLDTFYLPPSRSDSHITKIAPNNITHPTSNWQSIKGLILFMLISHLSKRTLLLRYLIYFWASNPTPFVAGRRICFSPGAREAEEGFPPVCVSVSFIRIFRPIIAWTPLHNQITALFHRRMY